MNFPAACFPFCFTPVHILDWLCPVDYAGLIYANPPWSHAA